MVTIGVIGANGQVGSEVCLFLSRVSDVKVIPICRTQLGSAFLRRCALECRHGELDSPEEAARLLVDCDLVADFSLPRGLPSEVRTATKSIIANAVRGAPRDARFVYISSMMALGVDHQSRLIRRHIPAHTTYGATKRYAEQLAFRLGQQVGREIYVLRLGQVHGELQAVSRELMRELKSETAYVPDGHSYTVFAFTIAEALVHIALGKERPGLYALVSAPEWSWKEVHEYYAHRRGIQAQIVLLAGESTTRPAWLCRVLSLVKQFTINPVVTFAIRHRELIGAYLLFACPSIERRLKAAHSRRNAMAQIAEGKNQGQYRPYSFSLLGRLPGQRLQTLSDSRMSMEPLASEVRRLLQGAVATCNVGPFRGGKVIVPPPSSCNKGD